MEIWKSFTGFNFFRTSKNFMKNAFFPEMSIIKKVFSFVQTMGDILYIKFLKNTILFNGNILVVTGITIELL